MADQLPDANDNRQHLGLTGRWLYGQSFAAEEMR